MKFIDTHAHLYDEAFAGEEDAAVERAVQAGVTRIVFPDIDSQSRDAMFSFADRHPGTIFPCLGLHPTSIDASWEKELSLLESYMSRKIWAIGEIGMDCYWSKEFVNEQQEAFRIQLELASKTDLPVIVHSRESTDLIIKTLKDCKHLAFLTPVPFRGKRNESAYIPHIAARLAELTGKEMEEIAECTTSNAEKLFRI